MMSIAFTQWVWVLATTIIWHSMMLILLFPADTILLNTRHPRGTGKPGNEENNSHRFWEAEVDMIISLMLKW